MLLPNPGSLSLEEFLASYEAAVRLPLNDDQKKAVRHGAGPLYVMAGPGSGKSELMVARTLKLVLVDGIRPGSIILTTFTEKAARNLEDRIATRLVGMGYATSFEDLRVGTLHSICDEIMREYRYPDYYDTRLLNEIEQAFFVYGHSEWIEDADRAFWDYFRYLHPRASRQFGPNKWQKTATLLTLFNRVTDELVDLSKLEKALDKPLRELAQATAAYHTCLRESGRSDFSYLQLQFLEFLKTKLGSTFVEGDEAKDLPPLKFLLVDEYQDTNPIQETIYFELARRCDGNLTIVGDDDQALYRFRGGTVECLVRFPDKCREILKKKPTVVQLKVNYRSVPKITKWSEQIIAAQPEMRKRGARAPKVPMENERAAANGYPPVCEVRGSNHEKAGVAVAGVVKELLSKKLVSDPSQIAILLKSSRESPRNAGPVANALRSVGIKVYNPRSKAFLEAEEIQSMLGALLEILDQGNHVGGTMGGFISESIAKWRTAYNSLAGRSVELRAYVDSVHRALASQKAGAWLPLTLRDVFYRILSREPFCDWTEDANRTFRLGQLSAILESFASSEDASDALRVSTLESGRFSHGWLRGRFYPRLIGYLHQATLDDPEDVDYQIVPGCVQIMTVHQSKGLEFPVVFVGSIDMSPNSEDATLKLEDLLTPFSEDPRTLCDAAERAVQDTVRFFYVAYSRAQNLVVLFGPDAAFNRARISVGQR